MLTVLLTAFPSAIKPPIIILFPLKLPPVIVTVLSIAFPKCSTQPPIIILFPLKLPPVIVTVLSIVSP